MLYIYYFVYIKKSNSKKRKEWHPNLTQQPFSELVSHWSLKSMKITLVTVAQCEFSCQVAQFMCHYYSIQIREINKTMEVLSKYRDKLTVGTIQLAKIVYILNFCGRILITFEPILLFLNHHVYSKATHCICRFSILLKYKQWNIHYTSTCMAMLKKN